MYDGSIVIGTELSTNKFDKQIADLDKKINKEEDKKIIIETKLTNQEQELERARQKADELADAYQKIKAVQEKVSQHKASPAEFETMQNLQAQYGTLEKIDGVFQKAISKQDELQLRVQETKNKYEAINNEISQYKQKIESINIQKQKSEVDQLKGSIDKVGNSFSGAVKKAGKLALAIFGIRSAYMMLRRASSELATYDEQYATNLEYIRFVLTQAIAPILKYIVNLAMQLLGWINAILQAWFGVNLFANGSVEAFQKMKKGANGVEKAVKQIKKQLLGFDEVNVLTDQSDTGTSAGAGGVTMPDFDLSAMQGDLPDWLKEIIKHKDEILAVLSGIATGLLLIKFGMSGIKALGFGLVVTGIMLAVQGLLGFIKDPSWANFGQIIQGIGIAIIGLGVIIGGAAGGWVVAIVGAVVLIVGTIVKHWETIRRWLDTAKATLDRWGEKITEFFVSKIEWIREHLTIFGLWITTIIYTWIMIAKETVSGFIGHVKSVFEKIYGGVKKILEGIVKIFKGDFWGGIKDVWDGILQFASGVIENIWYKFTWFWQAVVKMFQGGGEIFDGFKEGILDVLKTLLNIIIGGINYAIGTPLEMLNGILNGIKSVEIMGYKPFDGWYDWNPIPVPQIPYLKTGAIINMPNKGTLVGGGSAIGGEAGREGVLPLTDQQAMAELGREIGKNVLVNLTNIMQMNGRVISREMKQVQNTRDFAYNT